MMTSLILKSVDFTKTQKSRYLESETFFLQMKKFIDYTSRAKNSFVAELTFSEECQQIIRKMLHRMISHHFPSSYI